MNREEAKDIVKGKLEEYLLDKGLNPRKPFNCLNPLHEDKNPSMSFNRKDNRVKCFSCGASYDIFDLIGLDYDLKDNADIFKKAYSLYNIQVDNEAAGQPLKENKTIKKEVAADALNAGNENIAQYIVDCKKRIDKTDYLQKRGISENLIKQQAIGYDPNFKAGGGQVWQAVIIPTSLYSYVARNVNDAADKKDRIRKSKGSSFLYNGSILFKSEKPIIIVEGEIDALSIMEAGGQSIGLGSTDNHTKLIRILEEAKEKPKAPLIIALDNDETGEETALKLSKELERLQIKHYKQDLFNGLKDANDALLNDKEAFKEQIKAVENIEEEIEKVKKEEYQKNQASRHIQNFINGVAASVNTPATSTGFKKLDAALDGGLYEGLYICGAISSLGKTTFITQIADQMAQQGQDVIIFSLEMARYEIMAKSISRLTLIDTLVNNGKINHAKTARGITAGERYKHYSKEENELIQRAITQYSSYAGNIYILEGIGDIGVKEIRQEVENHIRYTGKKPIIIIDYIQILAPNDIRASDKQNTDKAVLELKRISRDFKTAVIGISSFNRENYKTEVSMIAFKESGAIEYGSDCLMGLQLKGAGDKNFNVEEAKAKDPREIELVILKNRNGKTGSKITYNYYPMFNYFNEE